MDKGIKKLYQKIDIPGYNCEFTSTEAEKGDILFYISQDLKNKNRSWTYPKQ